MTTSERRRQRVVVTGGAGFLGSHLCERLLDEDYEVLCLDNFSTGTQANVAHLLERGPFRLVRADVTDYVHIRGPVDAVLHFASPASPIDYLHLPIETLKVGSIGTLHTLGLARESMLAICWHRHRRHTGTQRSIRSRRPTGATSTRSDRAVCTTRRSGSRRP